MLKNHYSIEEFDPPAYVGLVHDNNVIRGHINRTTDKSVHHRLISLLFINTELIDMFRQGRTDSISNERRVIRGLRSLLKSAHESSMIGTNPNIYQTLDLYHDVYEKITEGVV